jgi:hypothetical protein
VSKYVLVTEESLARALYPRTHGKEKPRKCGSCEKDAAAILAAHPRETTDALMAAVEAARDYMDPTIYGYDKGQKRRRLNKALAALRERMDDEPDPRAGDFGSLSDLPPGYGA